MARYSTKRKHNVVMLREPLSHTADQLKEAVSQAVEEKRDELMHLMDRAYKGAKGMQRDAMVQARRMGNQVNRSVRHNPWPYVGAAAVTGLVLGLLARRR